MINLHISLTPFRNETRLLKESKSLIKSGVVDKVLIVAMHEDGLAEHEDIDKARSVWRVRLRSRNLSKSLFFQFLKYIELGWRISLHARRNEVHIVNVHSLGLLPLGAWLKFLLGSRLVYDAHELETEIDGLRGVRKLFSKIVERLLIRYTDLTIVVGSEIERWYRNAYSISTIVTVMNCPPYRSRACSQLLRDELNISENQKIVLYQGGLSQGRGVEILLDAFQSINRDDFVMVFMGYGELEARIKAAASQCQLIFYKPAVPPSLVLNYTASADIGIHPMEDMGLNHKLALPNKLFEYINARISVIVSNLPEMRRVVMQTGVGVVMRNWTAEALFEALDEIVRMDKPLLDHNLEQAAKLYCWEAQEQQMLNAYRHYVHTATC